MRKELYEGLTIRIDEDAGQVDIFVMHQETESRRSSIFYDRVLHGRNYRNRLAGALRKARRFIQKEVKYRRLRRRNDN